MMDTNGFLVTEPNTALSLLTLQEKVQILEDVLLTMPQAEVKTIHNFTPGKYERTIIIPPWTVLTGAPHKTDYMVRHEKGITTFTTDEGTKTLSNPSTFAAKAGTKRAGCSYEEEVIWTDIYDNPDDCRDISILEDRLYGIPKELLGENRMRLENKSTFLEVQGE